MLGGMKLNAATLAAHAGAEREQAEVRPHVDPLYQTSVYDFPTIAASVPALSGEGGHAYARNGLPNTDALGHAVAALEGAEAGLATSSGMGATTTVALSVCSQGDTVAVQRDAYGGTIAVLASDLTRFGIRTVAVDAYDLTALREASRGARLVMVESISNPLLKRVDLDAVSTICRENQALLCVDNTFATPLAVRPLERGADLVVHSATKFIGGHHDLIAGVVAGSREHVGPAEALAIRMGLTAQPFAAWLALRGLRTLDVRMRRAWENATELARRLNDAASVESVYSTDECALVSFDLGTYEAAERMVGATQLITLSPSLGGITTTLSHSATSSHRALTEEQREEIGVGPGLLRISVGVEAVDDLWRDLELGL